MYDLSIILPTCNRASLLERAITGIACGTKCDYEIIAVDGASSDRTGEVLEDARRLLGDRMKIIHEERREGFVKAANRGFRAASGKYMTWLNDDARPLPSALDRAVEQLDSLGETSGVGFVAMFHRWHTMWNVAYETEHRGRTFRLCHVRGTLYANFPVGLRSTFERLGYFDERYYLCAADPDLSLKAWNEGLSVVPAYASLIDHDEIEDDRRVIDATRGADDNLRLFEKWELPPRNPHKNDFDPRRPCTIRGLRSTAAAA